MSRGAFRIFSLTHHLLWNKESAVHSCFRSAFLKFIKIQDPISLCFARELVKCCFVPIYVDPRTGESLVQLHGFLSPEELLEKRAYHPLCCICVVLCMIMFIALRFIECMGGSFADVMVSLSYSFFYLTIFAAAFWLLMYIDVWRDVVCMFWRTCLAHIFDLAILCGCSWLLAHIDARARKCLAVVRSLSLEVGEPRLATAR